MGKRADTGASLVEIVIAVVVLGLAISAFAASLGTAALSSKSHRDLSTADTVLRSYAEATKVAVRIGCDVGGPNTFTVSYTEPPGFTAVPMPPATFVNQPCPSEATTETFTLIATGPNLSKTIDVVVRRP